jgi:hypothetical protein
MSFVLGGTTIKRPSKMNEANSTQYAANRVLSGANTRDYFGSNKRVWTLEFDNLNTTDYTTIQTLYLSYLASGAALTWQVSEGNYTVNQTNVLVDFQTRDFSIPGSSYISTCTLILTEA